MFNYLTNVYIICCFTLCLSNEITILTECYSCYLQGALGHMKPDQMQALNPILIIVFIPLFESVVYPLLDKCRIPNRYVWSTMCSLYFPQCPRQMVIVKASLVVSAGAFAQQFTTTAQIMLAVHCLKVNLFMSFCYWADVAPEINQKYSGLKNRRFKGGSNQ